MRPRWPLSICVAGLLSAAGLLPADPPPPVPTGQDAHAASASAVPGRSDAAGPTADLEHGLGAGAPRVILFNHGLDFPFAFERIFDFAQLPFAGQFRDATQNGIRVRATGLRHWVHLDGSPVGGRVARQPDAREEWTIDLPDNSHVFEFSLWESTIPGVGATTCFNFDFCTDVLYRIRVFNHDTVLKEIDFSPYNDQLNTVALWSSVPITRIVMTAEVNNIDDELLATLRVGASPLPAGLQFVPSPAAGGFGQHVAVGSGRALVTRSAGFELWRRTGTGTWAFAGERDSAGTVQRIALGPDHAAMAVATASGSRLEIYTVQGDDPAAWPVAGIDFAGTALALEVDSDRIAVGIDGQVLLYRRDAPGTWAFDSTLVPDPPIPGSSEFGRSLGMDDGLLVVNAGNGLFHVYQRNAGGQFLEVFRQLQSFTTQSRLDVSGSAVIVQSFEGGLRLFEPDGAGGWTATQFPFASMPPGIGLALAGGVRLDGDKLIALQAFRTPPSVEFRGIVSVWTRDAFGQFQRSGLFVEPHRAGSLPTLLGNNGRALALDGDDIALGLPSTPWCATTVANRSFFGDSGTQGYASVCGSRSGAAYFLSASRLGDGLFSGDFEP